MKPIPLPFPFNHLLPQKKKPSVTRHYPNYALMFPRLWRGYFWTLTVLLGMVYLYALARLVLAGAEGWSTLVKALGLTLLALWPLFGYAYQRKAAPRWLSMFFFWMAMGMTVVASLSMLFAGLKLGVQGSTGIWLLPAVLVLPYLFALHQYIFRSPHFWQAQAT